MCLMFKYWNKNKVRGSHSGAAQSLIEFLYHLFTTVIDIFSFLTKRQKNLNFSISHVLDLPIFSGKAIVASALPLHHSKSIWSLIKWTLWFGSDGIIRIFCLEATKYRRIISLNASVWICHAFTKVYSSKCLSSYSYS